jgi:hypothetical protein
MVTRFDRVGWRWAAEAEEIEIPRALDRHPIRSAPAAARRDLAGTKMTKISIK